MSAFYEDVFFYLDLTKEILKKKDLIKAIKNYIAEKNKINLKGHYGLLIFQEEGDPIFITGKKDSNIITNAIEENWKTRPKKQSFFENGLFYCFSYIAETVRKKSKQNRIIVITDTPSDLSEEYTEALFNLVSKIKNFPTFIDIIRISDKSERFFKDDVKLNILASDTNGEIFYVHEKKDFASIIKKLIIVKQDLEISGDKISKVKISKDDYDFYSYLAKDLIFPSLEQQDLKCYFCKEDICPVCTDINDIPLICEDCGSCYHNCCITNYAIQNNIGIPHIFRCPNPSCDILLKINQDDIVIPENSQIESAEKFIKQELEKNILNITETHQSEVSLHNRTKDEKPEVLKPKNVRIGGFFGKIYAVSKEGDKIVYRKIIKTPSDSDGDKKIEKKITTLERVVDKIKYRKPSVLSKDGVKQYPVQDIIRCPQCGTLIKSIEKVNNSCPYCGHKLLE
ncbi:MAG: zinc ribbon domain-containing protein [Promethearchaeota archaeon]